MKRLRRKHNRFDRLDAELQQRVAVLNVVRALSEYGVDDRRIASRIRVINFVPVSCRIDDVMWKVRERIARMKAAPFHFRVV